MLRRLLQFRSVNIDQFASLTVTKYELNVIKRWAGHSKWQNIRHTKTATDAEKARQFQRFSKLMAVAIREGGGANPELNHQLLNVIEQAKRANMPASSIKNSIKALASNKDTDTKALLYVRGPGRTVFQIAVLTSQHIRVKQTLTTMLRKHKCAYDNGAANEFDEKGMLVSELQSEAPDAFDKAVMDAITIGAEEVIQLDEPKKILFECAPSLTFKAKKELEALGYIIESAVNEFIPNRIVTLDGDDLEVCKKMLDKLQENPEVVGIVDNIDVVEA